MVNFDFYGEKQTYNSIISNIKELKKNNELLTNSFNYLMSKLKEFNDINDLQDYEIDIINSQIEYHKKLKQKYNLLIKNKHIITNNTINQLEKLINNSSKKNISIDDLKEIERVINIEDEKLKDTFLNTSSRDLIEENIKIIGGKEGLLDGIYETDNVEKLLDQLTITYLNELGEINSIKSKGLNINNENLIKILFKLVIKLRTQNYNYFPKIKIKYNGIEEEFNLNEINNQIKNEENKIEKEKDKKNKKDILFKIINKQLNKEDKKFLTKYLDLKSNNFDENLIYIYSKKILLEEILNKTELLLYFQTIKDFKLNDFLENFGLPYNFRIIYKALLKKYLIGKIINVEGKRYNFDEKFIDDNFELLCKNMNIFIQFLLNIESNGGDINAKNKTSSAKKAFQFMDGFNNTNGNPMKNKNGQNIYNRGKEDYSPFDTALRRANIFFTGLKYPDFNSDKCPDFIKNAWNKKNGKGLNELGVENEMIIWIIDMFLKEGSTEKIGGVIIGNQWAMRRLYEDHHLTTSQGNFTDNTSEEVTTKGINTYGPLLIQLK